jgi:hypothetical protein
VRLVAEALTGQHFDALHLIARSLVQGEVLAPGPYVGWDQGLIQITIPFSPILPREGEGVFVSYASKLATGRENPLDLIGARSFGIDAQQWFCT